LKAPDSILNFYRRVLALRHEDAALRDGEYVPLNESDPNVLAYLRRYKDEAVLVVLNMSPSPQKVTFDLQAQGLTASKATTMLTTGNEKGTSVSLQSITLDPFAVYMGKVGE
jgi:glycosidase